MKNEWTDADYEQMSWHDNHVHGLQIEGGGEHGTGLLVLDIDYTSSGCAAHWACAAGFRQTLRAEPVVSKSQVLEPEERRALPGYQPIP